MALNPRAARLCAQILVASATAVLGASLLVALLPAEREFVVALDCPAPAPRVRALFLDARALVEAGLVADTTPAERIAYELDERRTARAARWRDDEGRERRLERRSDGARIAWTLEGDARGRSVLLELSATTSAAAHPGGARARAVWRELHRCGPAASSRAGLAAAARARAAAVERALARLAAP